MGPTRLLSLKIEPSALSRGRRVVMWITAAWLKNQVAGDSSCTKFFLS